MSFPGGNTFSTNDVQDSQALISKIHSDIRQLSGTVDKINAYLSSFNKNSSPEILEEINSTKVKTNKLINIIRDDLKSLSNLPNVDRMDQRQIQLSIKQYSGEFSNILRRFQNIQQRIEDVETKMLRMAKSAARDYGRESEDYSDTSRLLSSDYEQNLITAEATSLDVYQREQSILQLESEVRDVNSIFMELNQMVIQQGEQIESIEDSVMRTTSNVNSGIEHLRQAQIYQSGSRRKKFLFIGLLAIIIVALILIVSLSGRKSSTQPK